MHTGNHRRSSSAFHSSLQARPGRIGLLCVRMSVRVCVFPIHMMCVQNSMCTNHSHAFHENIAESESEFRVACVRGTTTSSSSTTKATTTTTTPPTKTLLMTKPFAQRRDNGDTVDAGRGDTPLWPGKLLLCVCMCCCCVSKYVVLQTTAYKR